MKFEAVVNGKVVAEGTTLAEAIEKAAAQGFDRSLIKTRSTSERPRV